MRFFIDFFSILNDAIFYRCLKKKQNIVQTMRISDVFRKENAVKILDQICIFWKTKTITFSIKYLQKKIEAPVLQWSNLKWWPIEQNPVFYRPLGPEPAFGRLGLGGSSGGYSSHGYTSHASLRACGAQLRGDLSKQTFSPISRHVLLFLLFLDTFSLISRTKSV